MHIHLFEFMDLPWFPKFLRNIQTEILQVMMVKTPAFDNTVPYLRKILSKAKSEKILDLCSGASGPWLRLVPLLNADGSTPVKVLLSDKYPNKEIFSRIKEMSGNQIDYLTAPVDALDVPAELTAPRTVFTGYHHFKPHEAKAILDDAFAKRVNIGLFDFTPPRWLTLLLFPLTAIISFFQFLIYPFLIKPFRLSRIFWSLVIPVIPLVGIWDGFVSALRKYSKNELTDFVKDLNDNDYTWEIGQDYSVSKIVPLTYLIGYRK